jgi:hypothetical protein
MSLYINIYIYIHNGPVMGVYPYEIERYPNIGVHPDIWVYLDFGVHHDIGAYR